MICGIQKDGSLVEVDMMNRSYVYPTPTSLMLVAGDEFGQYGKGTYKFSVYYPGEGDIGSDPEVANFQELMEFFQNDKTESMIYLLTGGQTPSEIDYSIPKFQTASKALDMQKVLKDMGVGKIFSDGITLSGGTKTNIESYLDVGYFRTTEDGYGSLNNQDYMSAFIHSKKDLLKVDNTFYYFLFLYDPGIFLMAGKYDGD